MGTIDPRNIIKVTDAEALAHAAAARLIARVAVNQERCAICLTGGSGPKRLYELIASEPYRSQIPWDRVHWFVGDDRFVPLDDPLSNMGTARRLFLDQCALATHIHAIPVDAASPDKSALEYESMLKSFYGAQQLTPDRRLFDLVLMGLGPDGHTASLFPGYPAIEETERWVVGVPQAHVAPFVPRVTLTLPSLASCREMLFLVAGTGKRSILARVLAGDNLPAGRAHSLGETTWLVDDAALPDAPHA